MPPSWRFRNREDIVNGRWSLYTRKHKGGVWHGIGYLVYWSLWALVSNPSSDGGTINYWLVETLKHNLIQWENIQFYPDDVNRTGVISEGVESGTCPVDQQRRPGGHPVTAERLQKSLRWWWLKKKDSRLVHGKLLTPHWVNRIYWAETRQETRRDLSVTVWWTWRHCWHQMVRSLGRSTPERTLSSYSLSPSLFIVVMLPLNGCLHIIKNVARLYLSIEGGRGRGFISIEELYRVSANSCMATRKRAQRGCCKWL